MALERSLVFVKPDAVARGLASKILARMERKGLKIVALKLVHVSPALAQQHYAIHKGKPFYEGLVKFIQSGPVVACVVDGDGAISQVRRLFGATDPAKGAPGEVRFDYAVHIGRNLVHASDGPETAQAEVALWFRPEEMVSYARTDDAWLVE